MSRSFLVAALAAACLVAIGLPAAPSAAMADDVPDALSVEWQGKKPCEKLFEDAQVRVARCTFPPGVVHVCHSHPSYLSYVLSGGQGQVQDEKGTRKVDVVAGALADVVPILWHEFANIGETTLQFLIVEKKYQTVPPVSQAECPKGTGR
jgi:quercetin dioxygenase-like cupin family protein